MVPFYHALTCNIIANKCYSSEHSTTSWRSISGLLTKQIWRQMPKMVFHTMLKKVWLLSLTAEWCWVTRKGFKWFICTRFIACHNVELLGSWIYRCRTRTWSFVTSKLKQGRTNVLPFSKKPNCLSAEMNTSQLFHSANNRCKSNVLKVNSSNNFSTMFLQFWTFMANRTTASSWNKISLC